MHQQTLKPENYLDLWKYFTDDAAKIKDRMWTIASLFFAGITGLISFLVNIFLGIGKKIILQADKIILIVAASAVLYGLCYYFKYLMTQYGKHIRSGWNRANYIRAKIDGLSAIWFLGDTNFIELENKEGFDTGLPQEVKRLLKFTNLSVFFYSFVLLASCFILLN